MIPGAWLRFALAALLACLAIVCRANPISELAADGRLKIDTTLSPSGNIVPGQKLRLTLETATDRWFSGGTRMVIPEVPGLVILQNEKFASNASEVRDGATWVIQRWTLDVFPQRQGRFSIPPLQLTIKVNTDEMGSVEGTLYSPTTEFDVSTPAIMQALDQWVAAPVYEIRQSFDRDLQDIKVGDAFEQEVVFEASEVMAMMLPGYRATPPPGLAAYPSPAQLRNRSNRGETLATRSVTISYIAEKPGDYLLPEREFFWWNTTTGELQLLSLAATRIQVGGGSEINTTRDPRSVKLLVALALLLLLIFTLWRLLVNYLPTTRRERYAALLHDARQRFRNLRKPALAARLNPGSSAAE